MSTARVYRRLSTYDDESVVLLFRVDEFPDTLTLTANFGERDEPLTVERMTNDAIPDWFAGETIKDVTVRTSTATAAVVVDPPRRGPFYGVQIGREFARPGAYDVRFVVNGTLADVEAPQRTLIVARVDVTDDDGLAGQLAGGPILYADSPVDVDADAEILVVVPRMIRGVDFAVDFGDGTPPATLSPRAFAAADLPRWLLADAFSSPAPFLLTGRRVVHHGQLVRHRYAEPGIYAATVVVGTKPVQGDHCEVATSPATAVHVVDRSIPALSDLLGDDALVVPTALFVNTGFQALRRIENCTLCAPLTATTQVLHK